MTGLRRWLGRRTSRAAVLEALCAVWAAELGRPVEPDDRFFDLGGTSLDAVRIVSHAEERFGIAVPVRLVLQAPTVRAMAQAIHETMVHDGRR